MRTLALQPPPVPDRAESGGVLMAAIPMLGSVGSIALIATMGAHGALTYLAAGLCLMASLGFVVGQVLGRRRQRRARLDGQRGDYLRYLASVRAQLRAAAGEQREVLLRDHPSPAALPALAAEGSRLGERGAGDGRFLEVRYGLRTGPLDVDLVLPDPGSPGGRPDPVCARALERLVAVHREVEDVPATIDLRDRRRLRLAGGEEDRRGSARALVCSATALHPPSELVVAVLTTPAGRRRWEWVKWLPHALSPRLSDAVGPRRMVATSASDLAAMLPLEGQHVLLVVDGAAPPREVGARLTVIEAAAGGEHDLDASAAGTDRLDLVTAEAYARRTAPHHAAAVRGSGPRDLPTLLGLGDVQVLEPATSWRPRSERDRLRVPIGTDEAGEPVHLDLKESAQQGMGPHGLVVGATGSGKSELLRTLVLGLAATHPPDELNLVLIDFKGGATFAGLAGLPHVSAVITNLADDLSLVDRMHDALAGEMVRRQELLRAAGNLGSLADHVRARRADPGLAALPSLLVVVDEFSELLSARPDLTDLFVAIGRLGRSLGLHLLLASQRLEEGRLRGLESHLSYRIGLRTFSAHESRAVLGVADAYELPPDPGVGYLRSGPGAIVRFRSAYVSGPASAPAPVRTPGGDRRILPFGVGVVEGSSAPTVIRDRPPAGSVLEIAVARLTGHGTAAHRVWLPPLDRSPRLDSLLGDHADLMVPIGLVDRPREQRRDPLAVDLRGATGHVAVVGGPRSGKSALLRTLVSSLALSVSPLAAQIYVIDLGGGSFSRLGELPHVAGVATRGEPDVIRRMVAEIRSLLDRRERAAAGRAARGSDVFLVVDGWAGLRAEYEEMEIELQQVAQRGLAYGVHLLASAARWADFRPALRDLLGTRLELRLGEPSDSEVDRRLAAAVPQGRPGRGLTPEGRHFLAAEPVEEATLIARTRAAWPGVAAPRLRLLPERIDLDELHLATGLVSGAPGRRLLIGLDERELAPVTLDPDVDPHLLVLGEGRSGKSALLRTYAQEVIRTRPPAEAQLVVVDYRRALLGELADAHVLHHLTSSAQAAPVLEELAAYLTTRLPGPDVTPAQLRARSWWHGAEVFVLVDDYDLVATTQGSPLLALQPLLAQASDVGLHLVLARRTGGASRALYEPVVQTLRELAAPGLILSGDPAEGPLLGTTRAVRSPAGRARLVTRDETLVVQTAWIDPTGRPTVSDVNHAT